MYAVPYSLIYYPDEHTAFGAKVGESGCFHTTTAYLRENHFICQKQTLLYGVLC